MIAAAIPGRASDGEPMGSEQGIEIAGESGAGTEAVLTPEALDFLAGLCGAFGARVDTLVDERRERQARVDAGELPDFPTGATAARDRSWRVPAPPKDLADRRVELLLPADGEALAAGLETGAAVCIADCADTLSPTWSNVLAAQSRLRDLVEARAQAAHGAALMVRPRGWQWPEKHLRLDGRAVPAALVDVGLYVFHNADALERAGTGPYFWLPGIDSPEEAGLWTDVFRHCEARGVVAPGRIRASVQAETVPAVFAGDEILAELGNYATGLGCGRWGYILNFIRTFHRHPEFILPDRAELTMLTHFLRAWSQQVIAVAHRRGAHSIGGLAAQVPAGADGAADEQAIARVIADKEREVGDGHDGTWVGFPSLVAVAREVFDRRMPGPDQVERPLEDPHVSAADLLLVPRGRITERGVRANVRAALGYLAAWLDGRGRIVADGWLEDAATADIARAQLWQWVHHPTGILDTGQNVTLAWLRDILAEETDALRECAGDAPGRIDAAAELLAELTGRDAFTPDMMLEAYELVD